MAIFDALRHHEYSAGWRKKKEEQRGGRQVLGGSGNARRCLGRTASAASDALQQAAG
ncbi:MAG: hypothetical protein HY741_28350 [Chloroflexi bacterium]|nr:hypothetical protein [Chloroflexota bacterium]